MAEIIDITNNVKSEKNIEDLTSLTELKQVLAILEEALGENLDAPKALWREDFLVVEAPPEKSGDVIEINNVIQVDFIKKHRVDEVML